MRSIFPSSFKRRDLNNFPPYNSVLLSAYYFIIINLVYQFIYTYFCIQMVFPEIRYSVLLGGEDWN